MLLTSVIIFFCLIHFFLSLAAALVILFQGLGETSGEPEGIVFVIIIGIKIFWDEGNLYNFLFFICFYFFREKLVDEGS